jgi:hypothetical protein
VARPYILELLVQIGSGEPARAELEIGEPGILRMCLQETVRGMPMFVSVLGQSTGPNERASCVDLLGLCCRADPALMGRVRWYLERVLTEDIPAGLRRLIENWMEEVGSQNQADIHNT